MSDFKDKVLFVDYSKCIGCETCEAVCRFLYNTPRIVLLRTARGVMAPLYCKHCQDAPCMKACRHGALSRDEDGAVILESMHCRGCDTLNCLIACPYAAFFATSKGVAVEKCDFCKERRKKGMGPACAEMCPCAAVKVVDRAEVDKLNTPEAQKAYEHIMECMRPPVARLKEKAAEGADDKDGQKK